MSCDYHDRVDFRAFDVMVEAIDRALKPELRQALATANEMKQNMGLSDGKRRIWASFATLIRKELRS